MPWFIKTERFTSHAMQLLPEKRQLYITEHVSWVSNLRASGERVASGYLINEKKLPGGGGLLFIKAKSFEDAKIIIEQDPMITNQLVTWVLQEWIPVAGDLITTDLI